MSKLGLIGVVQIFHQLAVERSDLRYDLLQLLFAAESPGEPPDHPVGLPDVVLFVLPHAARGNEQRSQALDETRRIDDTGALFSTQLFVLHSDVLSGNLLLMSAQSIAILHLLRRSQQTLLLAQDQNDRIPVKTLEGPVRQTSLVSPSLESAALDCELGE